MELENSFRRWLERAERGVEYRYGDGSVCREGLDCSNELSGPDASAGFDH